MPKGHVNLLLKKKGEKRPIGSKICYVELLSQRLRMYSILLLVSSEKLIVESEAEHAQCLAAGQQREVDSRASESDAQREHWLSSN